MTKLKNKKLFGIVVLVILILGFVFVRNNLGNVWNVEIGS